jgi:hypothetical protein
MLADTSGTLFVIANALRWVCAIASARVWKIPTERRVRARGLQKTAEIRILRWTIEAPRHGKVTL